MCYDPATFYSIKKRGFIRESYFADLTIVEINSVWAISKENILSKYGLSPLDGTTFQTNVTHTFVNGNLVYENSQFN
jgi:dihydroorotase